jgi:thioredoxin-dependent peroxiredoxin
MKYSVLSLILFAFLNGSDAFTTITTPSTLVSSSSALHLKVGETAPDFSLQDQNGKTVKRSSFKKPLVVFFYPADSSPGCTVQATKFNDAVTSIRNQFKADVVGISGQDVASKQAFAKELKLSFSILADDGDKVRKAFDVPRAAFGLLPGRVTYILDKNGVCQKVYDDLANTESHVQVAKTVLATL